MLFVLSSLLTLLARSSPDDENFTLRGKITYITRISKGVTTQAKYSLTINNDSSDTALKVAYIFFWHTTPEGVSTSTDVSASNFNYAGRYSVLRVEFTSRPGSQSFEFPFDPAEIPIAVSQEIYVNEVAGETVFEDNSYFLKAEKGDVVAWKIRVENRLEAISANGNHVCPLLPIVVKFHLDERYFKRLKVSPEANSTIFSEPGLLTWYLMLRDAVEIHVRAQLSEPTEWGIIPTRSLSVEFDSSQYDYYVDALSSRREALGATMDVVKTIVNGSNFLSSGLYNISDILDDIGAGVSMGGSAMAYIGSALTSAYVQIQPAVSTLREYSSVLELIKDFSSRVDLAEVYSRVNASLPLIHSSLTSSYNLVSEDISRLLYVNNTLNQLLQASEDEEQKSAIISAIQYVTAIYNNDLSLRDTISMLTRSVESLEDAMANISVDQIRQLQSSLAGLPDVSASFASMADRLKAAGDALLEIGSREKDTGRALSDLAKYIRELTNSTMGASSSLIGYYNNLSSLLRQLDSDLSLIRMGQSIFLFNAPRGSLSLVRSQLSKPGTYRTLSLDLNETTFVNYLVIPKSSLQGVKVLDESGEELYNLTDIGSWEHSDLVYIPILQRVKDNTVELASWGVFPFSLNITSPTELVLAVSEPLDPKSCEVYCSINVDQPLIVSRVGITFLLPTPHPAAPPQGWSVNVIYVLLTSSLLLASIFLYIRERKKALYKRRKSILERYERLFRRDEPSPDDDA